MNGIPPHIWDGLVTVAALARNITKAEAAKWLAECVREREEKTMAEAAQEANTDADPQPFETDTEAWLNGHRLLLQLQELRQNPVPGAADDAERAIRRFCRCLRRSPHCALARVQRQFHLPDEAIIVVLYALAWRAGLGFSGSIDEVALVAIGFSPPALKEPYCTIRDQRGWGRLICMCDRKIAPSRILLDALRPAAWSDDEARRCHEQIAALPTVPYPEWRKQ